MRNCSVHLLTILSSALFLLQLSTASAIDGQQEIITRPRKQYLAMQKRERAREARYIRAAKKYLRAHPRKRKYLWPATLPLNSKAITSEITLRNGEKKSVKFQPVEHMLIDLGMALEQSMTAGNLKKLYSNVRTWVPDKYLAKYPSSRSFGRLPIKEKRKIVKGLAGTIHKKFRAILADISTVSHEILDENFLKDCTTETGYESAGDYSEDSARCDISEYSRSGLMANFDFILKDSLTCIKDQGNRGTCTMQAIIAAMESWILREGGNRENLSEQMTYTRGKISYDWEDRYEDGLGLGSSLLSLKDDAYLVQYENIWNYNRSLERSAEYLESNHKFLCSCRKYSGEMCTDYAFQVSETAYRSSTGNVAAYEYRLPASSSTSGRTVKDYVWVPFDAPDNNLEMAIFAVNYKVPVIICYQTTQSFHHPSRDGYVEHDPVEDSGGGHCSLMMGFVENRDLPAGVTPADERGYFILKNSWSTNDADCGFIYPSYGYLKIRGSAMAYLTDVR